MKALMLASISCIVVVALGILCPTCKGKGGYYQYNFDYERQELEYSPCYRCGGTGLRVK